MALESLQEEVLKDFAAFSGNQSGEI